MANASTSNKQVVGVPKVQANLLAEYSCRPCRNGFSANVHYTGKRAANDTNTSYASSYTHGIWERVTTKVSNVPTTFRVVVNNVFDKHYWASIFPSGTDGDNGSQAFIGGGPKCVHRHLRFLMDK